MTSSGDDAPSTGKSVQQISSVQSGRVKSTVPPIRGSIATAPAIATITSGRSHQRIGVTCDGSLTTILDSVSLLTVHDDRKRGAARRGAYFTAVHEQPFA
jgi:hypothetical protein